MSFTKMEITTAPNGTAYASDNPTRSTELYCNQVHNVLQDMDDAGDWYMRDDAYGPSVRDACATYVHEIVEDVYDYAASAIEDHRAEDPIGLTKPTTTTLTKPTGTYYPLLDEIKWRVYTEAFKIMFFIYYMWKTEEDPLLIKEKLRELLVAWPLLDTTIELASDLGQQFKVYPSWKNADL